MSVAKNKTKCKGAYLENEHFPPEKGHCVKIAITDVGFSIARRGPITNRRSRRAGQTVIFPIRRRVRPPWWEGWKRPSWLQHCNWNTWEVFQKLDFDQIQTWVEYTWHESNHIVNMSHKSIINKTNSHQCRPNINNGDTCQKILAQGSQTYRLLARTGPIKILIWPRKGLLKVNKSHLVVHN